MKDIKVLYETLLILALFSVIIFSILVNYNENYLSAWKLTQWAFNYEFGFVKRGLLGTIFQYLGVEVSEKSIARVQLATILSVSLLFVSTLHLFGRQAFYHAVRSKNYTACLCIAAFCSLILTSPGLVRQSLYDVGRFDGIGVFLILLAALSIMRMRSASSFIVCTAACMISIFVHEAFALWVAPICLSLWGWRQSFSRNSCLTIALISLVLCALTSFVSGSSYQDYFTFEQAKSELQEGLSFPISEQSLKIHFRTVVDNLTYSFERSWTEDRIIPFVFSIGFLLLYSITTFLPFFNPGIRSMKTFIILIVSAFLPITLVLVGHDQGRWMAMALCSVSVVAMCFLDKNPKVFDKMSILWPLTCFAFIGLQISLGPFGITQVFPEAFVSIR